MPSEFAIGGFIKTDDDLRTMHQQRPANQIRFFGHPLHSFRACRGMLGHIAIAVEFISRIQQFPVVALANQLIDFRFTQPLLIQITSGELNTQFEQETPCFATGGSSGLVKKQNFACGHKSMQSPLFYFWFASVTRNRRIDLHGPPVNSTRHRLGRRYALAAQPIRNIEATHSMMAIADHVIVTV